MKNSLFYNRELSYLDFNERVLETAKNKNTPLLEKAKFFAISLSNMEEFFSVRVSSLQNSKNKKNEKQTTEILREINKRTSLFFKNYGKNIKKFLISPLKKQGFSYVSSFNIGEKREMKAFFLRLKLEKRIFELTKSSAKNLKTMTLYIAFLLKNKKLCLISLEKGENFPIKFDNKKEKITSLSDIIIRFAPLIGAQFKGCKACLFIISRSSDVTADPFATNFVSDMRRVLRQRKISPVVSLIHSSKNRELTARLTFLLDIEKNCAFFSRLFFIPFVFAHLSSFPRTKNLRFPLAFPLRGAAAFSEKSFFHLLEERDLLLHFPYESFDGVLRFLEEAVRDDDVFEINMTIYRTNKNSPVIKLLKEGALRGKKVVVIVEIKARFDEARNISFGYELEKAGAKVIYGIKGLKIHAKLLLVKKKGANNEKKMAINLSTGNYNATTARSYSDLSLFTSDKLMCLDAEKIFLSIIQGDVSSLSTRKIITSPLYMKNFLVEKIQREVDAAKNGREAKIIVKVNNLTDKEMARSLYQASEEGVNLLLNIRGCCILKPEGKKRKGEMKIVSVVDRFLEHARIIYFLNGGKEEIYLSSADWMERNLERRVELLFPVKEKKIKARIKKILSSYFTCTKNAWQLSENGKWKKLKRRGESAQEFFCRSVRNGTFL